MLPLKEIEERLDLLISKMDSKRKYQYKLPSGNNNCTVSNMMAWRKNLRDMSWYSEESKNVQAVMQHANAVWRILDAESK